MIAHYAKGGRMADEVQNGAGQQTETIAAGEKKKKISKMTIIEIEKELKTLAEKMGGLGSRHAQQLLKRKHALNA